MSALWIIVALVVIALIAAAIFAATRQRLRPLSGEARQRYAQRWRLVEARFLDEPQEAVSQADSLALALLRERGARIEDDRKVPAEIRRARETTTSDTEGARRAMVMYGRIVDDAVGDEKARETESKRPEVA